MKNTWLYKKLDEVQNDSLGSDFHSKTTTGASFINIILLPLLGVVALLAPLLFILTFFLGIFKDLYDLYYHLNAEKLAKKEAIKKDLKLKNDIKNWINNYQLDLDKYPHLYCLKEIEKKSIKGGIKQDEIYLPTISYGRIPYNEKLHENTHLLTKKYIISLHKTYSDFIIEFFNNYNFSCITTSENGNYICDKDRRRSLHDLYLITKYYYPEITFKDIIITVISLINLKLLNGQYCNTVGKYVLYSNYKSRHNDYYGALELTKKFNFDDLKKYIENEK